MEQRPQGPTYEEKVTLLIRAIALKHAPETTKKLDIEFDPTLAATWKVNGNGSRPKVRISLPPNAKGFLARLDAALRQAERVLNPEPAPAMLLCERTAWGVLRSLGARQTIAFGDLALDLRPVRATSANAARSFLRAAREVAVPGGANTVAMKDGLPWLVLSKDREMLQLADVERPQDVTLPRST